MASYVVETNVAIVANDRPGHNINRSCALECISRLRECVEILGSGKRGWLCIDAGGEIMAEYRRHLSGSGQPGAGDAFFYELSQREYGDTCERVPITPQGHTYAEFPKTKSLDHFDPADHKFVAVALASQHDPAVLNAVDSDWLHHQTTLEQEGVRIEQLCPDCLKELPE